MNVINIVKKVYSERRERAKKEASQLFDHNQFIAARFFEMGACWALSRVLEEKVIAEQTEQFENAVPKGNTQ